MRLPKTPDQDGKSKGLRESFYTSTPVVLTVLATILAGLSSGELTRSQYYRAMAAQRQSKASDQWGYYQAKRLRAVEAQNSLDLLGAYAHPGKLEPRVLYGASSELGHGAAAQDAELHVVLGSAADSIAPFGEVNGRLPTAVEKPIGDADINQAMVAVDQNQSEAEMTPLLKHISNDQVDEALRTTDENLRAFDQSLDMAGTTLDRLHAIFAAEAEIAAQWARQQPSGSVTGAERDISAAAADVVAARFRFDAVRYTGEAKFNATSGRLHEVQVRQSGIESERHRGRSSKFFYGMLAAQAGVTISTLALAFKRRSAFWALAAATGAAAVAFSGYVYLWT